MKKQIYSSSKWLIFIGHHLEFWQPTKPASRRSPEQVLEFIELPVVFLSFPNPIPSYFQSSNFDIRQRWSLRQGEIFFRWNFFFFRSNFSIESWSVNWRSSIPRGAQLYKRFRWSSSHRSHQNFMLIVMLTMLQKRRRRQAQLINQKPLRVKLRHERREHPARRSE